MNDWQSIEKKFEEKFSQKDKRKKPKMRVTGKNVFLLKKLIESPNDRISKRKHR